MILIFKPYSSEESGYGEREQKGKTWIMIQIVRGLLPAFYSVAKYSGKSRRQELAVLFPSSQQELLLSFQCSKF